MLCSEVRCGAVLGEVLCSVRCCARCGAVLGDGFLAPPGGDVDPPLGSTKVFKL